MRDTELIEDIKKQNITLQSRCSELERQLKATKELLQSAISDAVTYRERFFRVSFNPPQYQSASFQIDPMRFYGLSEEQRMSQLKFVIYQVLRDLNSTIAKEDLLKELLLRK